MKKKAKILAAHARYRHKVEALLNELEPLGDALLNKRPADGGWSAMQTLHHLILVEENSMAYIRKKLSFNPSFDKVGLMAHLRSALLWISLVSPLKFKAPKSAGSERIPENASLKDTRVQWDRIRAEWSKFLEEMPESLVDKAVFRHPRAGRISWLHTLRFLDTHFDRHKAQVMRAVS